MQLQKLEETYRLQTQEDRQSIASYQSQVHNLTESLKKLQQQLAQTQALLAVVQEQRRALQDDNAKLRSELDEAFAKLSHARGLAASTYRTSVVEPLPLSAANGIGDYTNGTDFVGKAAVGNGGGEWKEGRASFN